MTPASRIFISHNTADSLLAEALVDLLVNGLGLAAEQIFCSSVEGHTIPTGTEFKEFMRTQLTSGAAVVALISPGYLENIWCVCELGATWVLTKEFYPILVPPLGYSNLPSFLAGTQALLLENESHLDRLSDGLPKLFDKSCNIAKWNTKKKAFAKHLPELLQNASGPTRLTLAEVNSLQKSLQDYEKYVEELTLKIEQLTTQYEIVSKLKDRKEVENAVQILSGESDQFDKIVAEANSEIRKLRNATKEALFYWYRGEAFIPGRDWSSDDVEPAVESGELTHDSNNLGTFYPNPEKPRVAKAMATLESLRLFAQAASPEFTESFEQHHEDNFDIESRDFWTRFLPGT